MSVRAAAGLSVASDPRAAAVEVGSAVRRDLAGDDPDLAVAFCSGDHLRDPEVTLHALREALGASTLVGCGAVGVLGEAHEVEQGTALSVWAADLGDGTATPFHARVEERPEGLALVGAPVVQGASAAIALVDPFTFPTEQALGAFAAAAPGVPLVGGLASARAGGSGVLFVDDEVVGEGAVGVRLDGVEMLPCVSQGAAPLGPELTVTGASGNRIRELAGAPALDKLRDVVEDLAFVDRSRVADGILVGLVLDPGQPEFRQGDFLVRPVLGADTDARALAVGARVEEGQVLRLHVRDAASADRDLREALDLRRVALGGEAPAGALVFTCNGRGRALFGRPDHDARAVASAFGEGVPTAGFFAAGEIGPVAGEPHLHGFTATVAVFPA